MIETKIQKAIAEQFGLGDVPVNLDSPFSEYDADSLDLVELVMSIEDELDVEIPDDALDLPGFGSDARKVTGRQLVELVTKLKG
jgi:acyl carrier protein